MIGGQLVSNLSRQLAEQTFHAIATDRNPEPSPHNDADSARTAVTLAHQQVEAGCGQPPAMLFHKFNVAARAKKKDSISCTPWHDPGIRRGHCPDPSARFCAPNSAGPLTVRL
jgi:hypothetical protein